MSETFTGSSPSSSARWVVILAGAIIAGAALVAYQGCFTVPFMFDDVDSILQNPTIRHLWPIGQVLSPPRGRGLTVEGRPVLNLSLAINYAFGDTKVWGYHAVNLAIHVLAGLTLFGIVRRTLQRPVRRKRIGASALPLALAIALIWTVHPLQTEAVTYVVQRAESLAGLFYLLTLYGFIRGTESAGAGQWFGLSVLACALGMATKEVMVTAPLMVLLYDRTFVAGNLAEAWRRRWRWYAGLACTWAVAGWLALGASGRGGTAGFGTTVSVWQYALTQCGAISHYLRLSVWPRHLVFDYGVRVFQNVTEVMPQMLLLVVLVVSTLLGLMYSPRIGFLGVWFFMILAPSSSIMPVASQTMAEHRMYLPLAAVITLVVLGIHRLIGRRSMAVFLALAVALGVVTSRRNEDYRSDLAIWSDTVKKLPRNARAHDNLGHALFRLGRTADAIPEYKEALRLDPGFASAHNNLGAALLQMGSMREALEHLERALQINPEYADAHDNLGLALLRVGSIAAAIDHFQQALRIDPDDADTHNNLGVALMQLGKLPGAIDEFARALQINPDDAEAHYNLGNALFKAGRIHDAIEHYEQALRIQPNDADARANLARARAAR